MNQSQLKDYIGQYISLTVNKKVISGIAVFLDSKIIKIDTDYGIVEISIEKITDIQKLKLQKQLNVYVCKNEICKCKGIRYLSSKQKICWPCKYLKQFHCPIKKICNYNELPLDIRFAFIDGMHSEIPVIEKE